MDLKNWQKGLDHYINNAIYLRDDGEILMEKGSLGHAYFFFYTALEELGVASFILENYHDPNPRELNRLLKSIGSHKRKSKLIIFNSFAEKIKDLDLPSNHLKEVFRTGESIEDFYARKLDKKLKIWEKRNRGIYVSLSKDTKKWFIPQDIILDDLKLIHEAVNTHIQNFKNAIVNMERLRKILKSQN
ncbi:MAG: AbiV family abortive infection protein [Promethearchaeota archaeon]